MRIFADVYPFVILALGISNALFILGTGVFMAVLIWTDTANDLFARMVPGGLCVFLANLMAGLVLAWTKWMLA